MTLYDEYRKEHPIAAEPSEFRDIVEAEVRRALEWMRGRDKPLPAEAIKPGRYEVEVREGPCCQVMKVPGIKGILYPSDFMGATFQAVEEVEDGD